LIEKLEEQEERPSLKQFYRGFAVVSILILPIAFYGTFIGFVIVKAKSEVFKFDKKFKQAKYYGEIAVKLS